jgi:cytoskeletal protein CcmA (bactofilin family)
MLNIFKKETQKPIPNSNSNISGLVRDKNDFFSDELILVDQKLSANLFCAEKIIIEQTGVLQGNITSKLCVVSGTINGNIVSTGQMDIKSTAVIKGNIKSALINIEPGAVINGCVTIVEDIEAVAGLSEKINEHSADEYIAAKLAWESAEAGHIDSSIIVEAAEKAQPILPVNTLYAARPSSKQPDQKSKENDNTNERWW